MRRPRSIDHIYASGQRRFDACLRDRSAPHLRLTPPSAMRLTLGTSDMIILPNWHAGLATESAHCSENRKGRQNSGKVP